MMDNQRINLKINLMEDRKIDQEINWTIDLVRGRRSSQRLNRKMVMIDQGMTQGILPQEEGIVDHKYLVFLGIHLVVTIESNQRLN